MDASERTLDGRPSQYVCPMAPDCPSAQRPDCFTDPPSCLPSCPYACSQASYLIPLASGSEASSPAGSLLDTPTTTLDFLRLHSPQIPDFTWFGVSPQGFLTSGDSMGLGLPSSACPTCAPSQDSLFAAGTLP